MANFDVCFDFLMDNEDAPRAYKQVPDVGGEAISGINSAVFPSEYNLIALIPQLQRGPTVESFYKSHFWNKWLAQLESDDVAKRVFDAAVNMGPGTAVKLLQQAVNETFPGGGMVSEDGVWGPGTVAATNACGPTPLIAAFQRARCAHYEAIGGPYLAAWLARAIK
jgi:lysozyme family protein